MVACKLQGSEFNVFGHLLFVQRSPVVGVTAFLRQLTKRDSIQFNTDCNVTVRLAVWTSWHAISIQRLSLMVLPHGEYYAIL